jgi:UV DNA damage repair endonuclease
MGNFDIENRMSMNSSALKTKYKGKNEQEFIRESIKELDSRINFKCARAPYDKRQNVVKKFLNYWEEKNTSMVYDWHKEVVSPEKVDKQVISYQRDSC